MQGRKDLLEAIILVVLVAACVAPAQPSKDAMICFNDKRIIDACYGVHGKIFLGANMRPQLQPIGSKRLLGIVQKSEAVNSDYYWPSDIEGMLDYDTDVAGDFYVCPFTPEESGKMRFVCVDTAANLKLQASPLQKKKD